MPLPKELKPIHIEKAVAHVEKECADLIDIYFEQPNVFSAIVGIFGIRALHAEGKGGRTHTFGVKKPSKILKGCAAYELPGIGIKNSKPYLKGS